MTKFKFKKSLGQNFLKDEQVLSKILDNINCTNNNLIIEIGPGSGNLTKYLKKLEKNLILYEVDKDTLPYLNKYIDSKTCLIYQDFLTADVKKDIMKFKHDKISFIANIPYYITTSIIKKIIDMNLDINEIILMVQNEVADRFCAKCNSKSYNSITIYLNYYFEVEKLFVVKKDSFIPTPNVDSAVIKLTPRTKKFNINDEELFFKFIKESFAFKRKTLKNNIRNYNFDKVLSVLEKNGYKENVRAEEIPIEVYVDIVNHL